jgi:hypothetical protein
LFVGAKASVPYFVFQANENCYIQFLIGFNTVFGGHDNTLAPTEILVEFIGRG